MALVNCKECKKEISSEAKICPHCGFKVKGSFGCLPVIGAGFAALMVLSILGQSPKSTSTSSSQPLDMRQSAAGACMLFINQSLHDPSSAEFDSTSEAYVDQNSATTWTVQRNVRAKNKFGALVLSTFECKIEITNGNWKALSIKEVN